MSTSNTFQYDLVKKSGARRSACLIVYIPLLLLLSNCAYSPMVPEISSPLKENLQLANTAQCSKFFVEIDRAVFLEPVVDAAEPRLPGFPYLRINRFLASLTDLVTDPVKDLADDTQRYTAWVDRLQVLDQRGRKIELNNLSVPVYQQLLSKFYPVFYGTPYKNNSIDKTLFDIVVLCGDRLRVVDMAQASRRLSLVDSAVVRSEYQTLSRVAGLYPITGLFVKLGINSYHEETLAMFRTPLSRIELKGQPEYYVMDADTDKLSVSVIQKILAASAKNVLSIPEPSVQDLQKLFVTFAPVIKVDVQGNYDRLGAPGWDENAAVKIDTNSAMMYTLVSHVWFEGQILLQLNYVMWFPERPLEGTFDILGGHIDGLNWRVTIGSDGRPLIYDVMHNCGCYHMFLPGPELTLRQVSGVYEELPLVPQVAPQAVNQSVVLHIEGKTHYLQRVTVVDQIKGNAYTLKDYNLLRSLPLSAAAGHKNLFDWDGIVKGTERAERWILWPMGVPEPGAMRQWGRHATAFIGQRHFDDPDLLDRYFFSNKDSILDF